jgi:N-formylglutamate deformylase
MYPQYSLMLQKTMSILAIPGVYEVIKAPNPIPLIIDSPHSGRDYPDDFNYICSQTVLTMAEDNYIDELSQSATNYGAHFLKALFPRTYIDVNRASDDIDTSIIEGEWPHQVNPSRLTNLGYGLIRRLIVPGSPIYRNKLSVDHIEERIRKYYVPYHQMLATLINDCHTQFGAVWHLDMHAMPSLGRTIKRNGRLFGVHQADFVLGDRDATSCNRDFTYMVRDSLKEMGYKVAINDPYKGVEIVRLCGNPHYDRHSLQIEINKGLYWEERNTKKNNNFNSLSSDIEQLFKDVSFYIREQLPLLNAAQ